MSIEVKRKISGNLTTLSDVKDILINNQEIIVLNGQNLIAFSRSSNGDIAPSRIIKNDISTTAVGIEIDGNNLVIRKSDGSKENISL